MVYTPTSKIDGNAGIMRVTEGFLRDYGARRRRPEPIPPINEPFRLNE